LQDRMSGAAMTEAESPEAKPYGTGV
jgi:hypothetical protein